MIAALLLFAVPPTAAYAVVVTYYSAAFCPANSGGDTAGWALRDYNRVYRPVGNTFKLYYGTGSTYYDTWSNPFVTPGSSHSDTAGCRNQEASAVANVTCQTTT